MVYSVIDFHLQAILRNDLEVSYPIVEHFYTIQGEGYWSGTPAYFIRLAGCNVGCVWCDVKESWQADQHPSLTLNELRKAVINTPAHHIVITGGEPTLHDLAPLTQAFQDYQLHLETAGTNPLSGQFDWICFSPKKFKNPLPEYYRLAHELKIIVYNKHDFSWAESHAAEISASCICYLQPEWSRAESPGWIIEYIKKHPQWKISMQTHKYLNIP